MAEAGRRYWLDGVAEETRNALIQVAGEYIIWKGSFAVSKLGDRTFDLREDIKADLLGTKDEKDKDKNPIERNEHLIASMHELSIQAGEDGTICPEDLVVTLVRESAKKLMAATEAQQVN
ncbi:MAG TPA: hypothetical protein VHB51_00160 [Candidatus Saccharimonadales bacterium]|nr:hypothetical protein [Candidatus Saccharimonadales bacterium]